MFASPFTGFSQGSVELEFEAQGCCSMCGDRIEAVLDVRGVRMAEWRRDDKTVRVVYKPKKIGPEQLERLVADAGHDTKRFRAEDEAYAALPGCCSYRDGCTGCSEVHGGHGDHEEGDHGHDDDKRK